MGSRRDKSWAPSCRYDNNDDYQGKKTTTTYNILFGGAQCMSLEPSSHVSLGHEKHTSTVLPEKQKATPESVHSVIIGAHPRPPQKKQEY